MAGTFAGLLGAWGRVCPVGQRLITKHGERMQGRFCKENPAPKTAFDRRGFRWIHRGSTWILVGCPRGKWHARKRRCATGTRAQAILRPAR